MARLRRPRPARIWPLVALLAAGATACRQEVREPAPPRLDARQIARLIPEKVKDRDGWAADVLAAFDANGLWPDATGVCSVLAVIEQESGYQANPVVPGLAAIVRRELEERVAHKLGVVGKPALRELLKGKAPQTQATFDERLNQVKTEGELDKLFRDILDHYRHGFPNTYHVVNLASALSGKGELTDFNPITTAGSMQVAVDFAQEHAKRRQRESCCVRDELYTRAGGVFYGTARLVGYEAGYDRPLFRFADYNAGVYAARNAAFQAQLAELTGHKLATDGDLLAYDDRDNPLPQDGQTMKALLVFREKSSPGLAEWWLRREVRKEKERAFEETETWRAVKRTWQERFGKAPVYARLPEVAIRSPKLAKVRSTAWFARSVDARYQRCMARAARVP